MRSQPLSLTYCYNSYHTRNDRHTHTERSGCVVKVVLGRDSSVWLFRAESPQLAFSGSIKVFAHDLRTILTDEYEYSLVSISTVWSFLYHTYIL